MDTLRESRFTLVTNVLQLAHYKAETVTLQANKKRVQRVLIGVAE